MINKAEPHAKLLQLLKQPEDLLEQTDQEKLSQICRELFAQVEQQHQLLRKVIGSEDGSSLTGLQELYVNDDAETVWGQVELQNNALIRPFFKKSIKHLSSAVTDGDITLLDMKEVAPNSEPSEGESESKNENQSGNGSEERSDEDDDENPDDEAKRMEDRMARAMLDMEDDKCDEEENITEESNKNVSEQIDQPVDPVRESMMDGFFDLHEMEAFADEEEEYLPDAAFGQEKEEEEGIFESKASFHERQRRGDEILNDDEEGSDDDDLLINRQNLLRRKKYRPDDEIRTLLTMYDTPLPQSDDDEVANMTAADFFGKPNLKARKEWLKKKKTTPDHVTKMDNFDDADSWDDHDFENNTGWNDQEENDVVEDDVSSENERGVVITSNSEEPLSFRKPKDSANNHKLLNQTEDLEREMLAEKPWQMKGETQGTSRPVNSLLGSTPEFETASKTAPIITVQHTLSLEEIIKRRILAEEWDDIVPRELPDVGWNKKRGELPEVSQEQSKLGLGELYEREYLKKAVGYDVENAERETEEKKAKDEMRALFANLCSKLDALSNYHFAPRPIADEAEIRPVSTPAIAMEEVLPLHVSTARAVAPEEIFTTKKSREGVLTADSELTQAERKKRRNAKKNARRKVRKERLADEKLVSRLQPSSIHNPYEKRKMREELQMARSKGKVTTGIDDKNSDYGKSTTFFQRLQNDVSNTVSGSDEAGNLRKRKHSSVNQSSSSHKL